VSTVAELLADYVTGAERAGDPVRHGAARAFLDTLTVAVAGRAEPTTTAASSWAVSTMATTDGSAARDWTTGARLATCEAAFVNGVASHALDLDDVSMAMWGHPSTLIVPVVVALAEAGGATVGDCLDAYAVGLQVDVSLSAGFELVEHYARGWHASVTVGLVGAVAAGSRLLALTPEQTRNALGLAVSMASGSRENFGTMAKPMHIGFAASSAVRACQLAAAGVDASDTAFEGPLGFFALYTSGPHDAGAVASALEISPAAALATINTKSYPCCYQTHRDIDAALDLNARLDAGELARITRVVVTVNPGSDNSLIHPFATTPAQARFCMRYVVASALLGGVVDFATFAPERIPDPTVQDLMRRVELAHQTVPPFGDPAYTLDYAALQVTTSGGVTHEATCAVPRGNEERPLTDEELLAKAEACLRHARLRPGAADLVSLLADPQTSAAALVDTLRALDESHVDTVPAPIRPERTSP
jgi:2-methylcitrate dehydratase PrpD